MSIMSKQQLVDNYNQMLSEMIHNDMDMTKLGFITTSCDSMLFSILIHCIENVEIFNTEQLSNINSFINRLSYDKRT